MISLSAFSEFGDKWQDFAKSGIFARITTISKLLAIFLPYKFDVACISLDMGGNYQLQLMFDFY